MSVTAPLGFTAAGLTAGLKPSGTKDLSLVINNGPDTAAAAVFTSNRCKANPVLWSQKGLRQRAGPCRRPQLRGSELLHRRLRLRDDHPDRADHCRTPHRRRHRHGA